VIKCEFKAKVRDKVAIVNSTLVRGALVSPLSSKPEGLMDPVNSEACARYMGFVNCKNPLRWCGIEIAPGRPYEKKYQATLCHGDDESTTWRNWEQVRFNLFSGISRYWILIISNSDSNYRTNKEGNVSQQIPSILTRISKFECVEHMNYTRRSSSSYRTE
jgi:hypothetical protein